MKLVSVLKNEVKVSKECAEDLLKAHPQKRWGCVDDIIFGDKLSFDPDHSGRVDFLRDKRFTNVLCKHKAKGDICFGFLDGNNAGSFWGYRFDGKGGMIRLEGSIEFKEIPWPEDKN